MNKKGDPFFNIYYKENSTMKKFKKKHIRGINECLTDDHLEEICDTTNLCEPTPTLRYEGIYIENMYERLHKLKLKLEQNKGTIIFFENECRVIGTEISRLLEKINMIKENEIEG